MPGTKGCIIIQMSFTSDSGRLVLLINRSCWQIRSKPTFSKHSFSSKKETTNLNFKAWSHALLTLLCIDFHEDRAMKLLYSRLRVWLVKWRECISNSYWFYFHFCLVPLHSFNIILMQVNCCAMCNLIKFCKFNNLIKLWFSMFKIKDKRF